MSGDDGRRTTRIPSTIPPSRIMLRAIAVLSILLGMVLGILSPVLAQDAPPVVETIAVDGTITPVMARYIERGISRAENRNADAVVLEIDTPGGLSSAMDDIIRSILESEVPVVAYVTPRGAHAASAGVYIAYASHISAMAPGTNIGSASPVSIGGDDSMNDETMNRKVTNDAVAKIRNLADFRGRNADWAESAVREAVNITADEALSLGVIDVVAPDVASLLNEIDGRQVMMHSGDLHTLHTSSAELDTFKMNILERLLQLIADPTIAYLLISIGSLGIFLELSNPGAMLPGIVGVLALLFGLFGLGTVPVNWTGAILIGIGLALFFVDIYVASFGTLLIGGLACFIVGSYLLIDTTVPGYDGVSRPVIWASAACVVGSAFFIGLSVMRIRRKTPQTGKPAMLGDIGLVRQELNPRGMVFVNGELWSARLEDDNAAPLAVGQKVEILDVTGLLLTVKPAPADVPVTRSNVLEPRDAGVIPTPGTERI